MENSLCLMFYLKKQKSLLQGLVPIYFRITVDGSAREISARLNADRKCWSSKADRLTGKSDDVKSVNEYLDLLEMKAIQASTKLMVLEKPVTADNIKLLVMGKPL